MQILELEQMLVENEQATRNALTANDTYTAMQLMEARAAIKDSLIYELKVQCGMVKERRSKPRTNSKAA